MVQWLGFSAFTAWAWIQSLLGNQKSASYSMTTDKIKMGFYWIVFLFLVRCNMTYFVCFDYVPYEIFSKLDLRKAWPSYISSLIKSS